MKKLQTKLFLIFLVFSTFTSGLSIILFYNSAYEKVMTDIRHRLKDITSIAAKSIDSEIHKKIVSPEQENLVNYLMIKKQLRTIKKASSDIFYIYTMRENKEGKISFVVDEEENPALMAHLGETYDDASPLLQSHFNDLDSTIVENDFYEDEWGIWLSAYSPFYDQNGNREGVIGIDISAETVKKYRDKLINISLLIFFITLPLFLALGYIIGRKIAHPVIVMKEAAEEIGHGKLDTVIDIDRKDEIGHLANSFNTMTKRLKNSQSSLEEALHKYKKIFDNAVEGIFQSTLEGKLLTANKALIEMLGYQDRSDFFGQIMSLKEDLYSNPADRDKMIEHLKKDQKVSFFETSLKKKDGSNAWVEMNAHLITTRHGDQLIEGILHDISARREKEKAEQERKTAEAASQAKSEFLANMSHEIRTPLNAVMGMTDLVMRTQLSDKQKDYLRKIKISSKTLLSVINDILDFSKIEAGRLELEEINFSLYEVMANLSEIFAQRAHEQKIELMISIDKETPNALVGDPVRLGQILINLTGNALKFTSEGEIVISVKEIKSLTDGSVVLEFSVRDTGVGIKPDRLKHIFESFSQEDSSTTRKFGGTGLGLSICKKLSRLMGGDISVESELGKGSRFYFTARFQTQSEDKQLKLKPPKDLRGLKVLIVDDNATSREILSQTIESFQMTAIAMKDAESAIDLIQNKNEKFDLILMDWKLPNINGLEATKIIKQGYKENKAPVIFMVSAYGREDLLQQSEQSLIDAFLHKPINQSFLFDTIMGLFNKDENVKSISEDDLKDADEMARHPHFKNLKVLLVEDNKINQEIALEWLNNASMAPEVAENGKEAVEKALTGKYELVLMDIQLPEMDGYTATKEIRKNARFKSLPIIAMTAHALKGDKEKCVAAGMNDYITKPVDPFKMFSTIKKWLPKKGALKNAPSAPSPKTADTPATLNLPGINTSSGLFRVNNNLQLYKKLLNSFRNDYRDTEAKLSSIYKTYSSSDMEEARRIAHSFKGVGANLGAESLAKKAADLEMEIKNGHWDFKSKANEAFLNELNKIISTLDNEFSEQNEVPEPESHKKFINLSRKDLNDILIKITTLLDEDLEEAEKTIKNNILSFKSLFTEEDLSEMLNSVENFEIDQAKELINRYVKSQ